VNLCKGLAVRPYEEIVEFIASLSPREVVEFKPSEEARKRVWELLERQKAHFARARREAGVGSLPRSRTPDALSQSPCPATLGSWPVTSASALATLWLSERITSVRIESSNITRAATEKLLEFNHENRLRERETLAQAGRYPTI